MGDSLSAGDCLLISGTAAALDSAKYNKSGLIATHQYHTLLSFFMQLVQ